MLESLLSTDKTFWTNILSDIVLGLTEEEYAPLDSFYKLVAWMPNNAWKYL